MVCQQNRQPSLEKERNIEFLVKWKSRGFHMGACIQLANEFGGPSTITLMLSHIKRWWDSAKKEWTNDITKESSNQKCKKIRAPESNRKW